MALLGMVVAACGHGAFASTFKWIEPNPVELSMKEYPKAPGAPAIILSYEEEDDATSAEVLVHVRVKVLTDGGLSAANVEMPERNTPFDEQAYGRTIHPDGSVVPFTGKPYEKFDGGTATSKVMALPGVTVGSILEYGYHLPSLNTIYTSLDGLYAPRWEVQQNYFVVAGHFRMDTPDIPSGTLRWVSNLPAGAEIKQTKKRVELNVADVAGLPDEEFSPPANTVSYRVRFFYWSRDRDKFWGETGSEMDDEWLLFYQPSKVLSQSVSQILTPTDTDEQKLRKLYDAVMKLENTDLTRERSVKEDKKLGLKEAEKAEDVWLRKRGDSDQLALLFVALARAAGFQSYPMAVTSRDTNTFSQDVLSRNQFDSILAVVVFKGNPAFLDPGTRGCPFGHLAWWHSGAVGMSIEGKKLVFLQTPSEQAGGSLTRRVADLLLDADMNLTGTVQVTYKDCAGLKLRRQFLREDKPAVEVALQKEMQDTVPAGVQLKLASLTGLEDFNAPLIVTFDATGTIGTKAGKRMLIPTQFFAGSAKPSLTAAKRTLPVSFPQAFMMQDVLRITLPKTLAVEKLPEPKTLSLAKESSYAAKTAVINANANGPVVVQRTFMLGRLNYKPNEYEALRAYYGQIASSDQEEMVLHTVTP
jgi:hypothetical protein